MSQKTVHNISATNVEAQNLSANDVRVHENFLLKGIIVVSPKGGNKIQMGAISPGVIVAPSTPLNELTIIFPIHPEDGQVMFLSFTQDIKKVIFVNGNFANQSTLGPTVKAGDSIMLFFHSKTNKWYKVLGTTNTTPATPSPQPTTPVPAPAPAPTPAPTPSK